MTRSTRWSLIALLVVLGIVVWAFFGPDRPLHWTLNVLAVLAGLALIYVSIRHWNRP